MLNKVIPLILLVCLMACTPEHHARDRIQTDNELEELVSLCWEHHQFRNMGDTSMFEEGWEDCDKITDLHSRAIVQAYTKQSKADHARVKDYLATHPIVEEH